MPIDLDKPRTELTSLAKERDRCRAERLTAQGQLAAQFGVLREDHSVASLDEASARREQLAEQIKQVGQWVREQINDTLRRLNEALD